MTELDTELPEVVLELIEEFGATVQYRFVASGDYNPATGNNAPAGDPFPLKALLGDYDGQYLAKGLVERGDKQVYAAALSFVEKPTSGDEITIDNELYTVIQRKDYYSGDLVALYELQARK